MKCFNNHCIPNPCDESGLRNPPLYDNVDLSSKCNDGTYIEDQNDDGTPYSVCPELNTTEEGVNAEMNGYYFEYNNQKTTLGLLDRLRSLPGLKISGFDERNAEVYLRGQTSVNFYKEVVFYINGTRVGNYNSAYQAVLPENIDSIKLLKSASELNIYGSDGRDGVVLIKTKN
mgnify:CR=1 FL=1